MPYDFYMAVSTVYAYRVIFRKYFWIKAYKFETKIQKHILPNMVYDNVTEDMSLSVMLYFEMPVFIYCNLI